METEKKVEELKEILNKSEYKPIESLIEKVSKLRLSKDKEGNKLTLKEFFSRFLLLE